MKVFISADIEGITGVTDWEEIKENNPGFRYFQERMTEEVLAACEGALAAGATEILVKDAHGKGRNLIPSRFPECVRIIRGWSGHPYAMMQELDESFSAALLIGYHSAAGSSGHPLSHTMAGDIIKMNGERISEFVLNTYTAMMVEVPLVFVAGDEILSREVRRFNEKIETVVTQEGIGGSTISIHPKLTVKKIREAVEKVLKTDLSHFNPPLPKQFSVEVQYRKHQDAYRNSFYPGVKVITENTIEFNSDNYFDVLRFIMFQGARS